SEAAASAVPGAEPERLSLGDIRVDLGARQAWRASRALPLTPAEFDVLAALVRSAGRLLSRDQLAREALGRSLDPLDRAIDVHVGNLRRKLGTDAAGESPIRTVRGAGYLLPRADPDDPR